MAKNLDWTNEQLMEVLGYLANPVVGTRLEIQVRPDGQAAFEQVYLDATGTTAPSPGEQGYSVLRPSSDKRGPQMRVYLTPSGRTPRQLVPIIKNGHRKQQRISRNELVYAMLKRGFLIGSPTLERILPRIKKPERAAFGRGFDLGSVVPDQTMFE